LEAVNEKMDQEEKFSEQEGLKALELMEEKELVQVSGKIVYAI